MAERRAFLIDERRTRVLRVVRRRYASPRVLRRTLLFWGGAVLVSAIAMVFAWAANGAAGLFGRASAARPWLPFIVSPAGLALSVWLTRTVFPGAQGSGIPQTIAALHLGDAPLVDRILSLRIAAGKVCLTLLGLLCGAAIGREGPTVQIGAAVMHTLGRLARLPSPELRRALILAGGAAGIAAAFDTPLAGVVFAIEELSRSFESRTNGVVLTAVILAGATSVAVLGNYTYFGTASAALPFGSAWLAVPLCSVAGGLLGGTFARALILAADGWSGAFGRFFGPRPVAFAVLCGLAIAVLGTISGGTTFGTGYEQARALIAGTAHLPAIYALLKCLATVVSYISGIPGGIFAPSLAVGAGIGAALAHLLPSAPLGAMILLGMVAYFSGAVQAPITAAVIVMEMTDNQTVTVPLMATSAFAFAISRLVCPRALYGALAERFLAAQGVKVGELE